MTKTLPRLHFGLYHYEGCVDFRSSVCLTLFWTMVCKLLYLLK